MHLHRIVPILAPALILGLAGILITPTPGAAKPRLPFDTIFVGEKQFYALVKRAEKENWRRLPLGQRAATVGAALVGTRYENFTLEIDDHIESPSVNFHGMDCWTFFEISLGFARMLTVKDGNYHPNDLLRMIEMDRYRGGYCDGNYLSRIHYLAEWYYDNEKRGLIDNPTRGLGGERISRKCTEMTNLWRHYRYLKNNPNLLKPMGRIERQVSAMRVYHIPKNRVAGIESKLRSGDIIGITSAYDGGYCSHVGMIYKDRNGRARFMHASRDAKKVIIDVPISQYLRRYRKHAGIIVGRPKEVSYRDFANRR